MYNKIKIRKNTVRRSDSSISNINVITFTQSWCNVTTRTARYVPAFTLHSLLCSVGVLVTIWVHVFLQLTMWACGDVQQEFVTLCNACHRSIHKGKAQPLSLAAGRDLGNPELLGLLRPTVLECAVLQGVRLYGMVLKVQLAALGSGIDTRKLSGHFISFFSEGPEVVAGYLTTDAVRESIQVNASPKLLLAHECQTK